MTDPFASPDLLRRWLEGFKPRQCVGVIIMPQRCPAAKYLNDIGYKDAHVVPYGWGYDPADGLKRATYESPIWLFRFILAIDRQGPAGARIQARTALRILAEVTQ